MKAQHRSAERGGVCVLPSAVFSDIIFDEIQFVVEGVVKKVCEKLLSHIQLSFQRVFLRELAVITNLFPVVVDRFALQQFPNSLLFAEIIFPRLRPALRG